MLKRYVLRPLEHGLVSDYPSLHTPSGFTPDILNCKVDQHSIKNRLGLSTAYRNLGTGVEVQGIILHQMKTGTRNTLYLTRDYVDYSGSADMVIVGDLCQLQTGTDETFSYVTEMGEYADTINGIVGDTVTAKSGTNFSTDGIGIGDYFIINDTTDFKYPNREPLTNTGEDGSHWMIIEAVGTTTLTLKAIYTGQTSVANDTWSASPKSALIRKTFKCPNNERYTRCFADDKLFISSGGDNVKYWIGSGYAIDIDAVYAVKARHMIEYANRLCIADHGSTRNPYSVRTSANGNPAKWSTEDTTAVDYDFLETEDYITGLGKVSADIVVFKEESVIMGHKTGRATDPISFTTQKRGIGNLAPGSIVHAQGTCMFLGNNDFYYIDVNQPRPLSKAKARYRFFDIVSPTETKNTWGFYNIHENEIQWIANTENGKFSFVLNLINDEWSIYQYAQDLTAAGKGAK